MFIVFVTAYMQYAIESYRMDAFQYVLKSELSDRLPRILGKLTEMIEKDKKSYGFVGTESNRKKVFYDDIIWLKKEKNAKYVTYILKNGRYTERASLESAVEKLDYMQFLNEGAQMAIEPEKAAKTRMDAERFLFHFLQNQGMQE